MSERRVERRCLKDEVELEVSERRVERRGV